MKTLEVLRTRGLPFSLMTTTHGLLILADGEGTQLYTHCPQFGVMRGLGDFDDRPRMYTPKCLQLFNAPVEDLRRMKREWEAAVLTNDRYGLRAIERLSNDAPLPFIAKLAAPITPHEQDAGVAAFAELCDEIEKEEDQG